MQKNVTLQSKESKCSSRFKPQSVTAWRAELRSENCLLKEAGRQREVFPGDSELTDMAGNFLVLTQFVTHGGVPVGQKLGQQVVSSLLTLFYLFYLRV